MKFESKINSKKKVLFNENLNAVVRGMGGECGIPNAAPVNPQSAKEGPFFLHPVNVAGDRLPVGEAEPMAGVRGTAGGHQAGRKI